MRTETPITKPSLKDRQRQLREDTILDAAVELLNSKGFNAMTLEDITESVGISRPTLYQHFSSKEDVLIHIAIRTISLANSVLENQDPSRSGTERLKEFITWGINWRYGPNYTPFYDLNRLVLSCGKVEEQMRGPQEAFIENFTRLVAEAQADKGVRSDVRPLLLAEMFVSLLKNVAFDQLIQSGQTSPGELGDFVWKLMSSH